MSSASIALRLKAGGVHLGISTLVALIAMALIFLIWYPGNLAVAQGVDWLVLILIGVDVVLGPLMTTLVFNPGKGWKLLKMDLAIIGTLQLCALLYGMHTIFGGRPAYVVYNVDRFDVVAAVELNAESLALARERGQVGPSWWGPRTVAARLPSRRSDARSAILFSAMAGGADLPQLPEYFVPYVDEKAAVLKHLRPMEDLRKVNNLDAVKWKELIDSFGRPEAELGYLPMRANARDGSVVVNAKTAEVLGIRLLQPRWESPAKRGIAPEKKKPRLVRGGKGIG